MDMAPGRWPRVDNLYCGRSLIIPSWPKLLGWGQAGTTRQRSRQLSSAGSKPCKRACRRSWTYLWHGNAGTGNFFPKPIHYPETDGKPVTYTDVSIEVLICLREVLRDHFRDALQVYVEAD